MRRYRDPCPAPWVRSVRLASHLRPRHTAAHADTPLADTSPPPRPSLSPSSWSPSARGTELVVSPYDRDISWGEIQKDYSGWMLDEGLLDLYHYFLDAALERLLGDW